MVLCRKHESHVSISAAKIHSVKAGVASVNDSMIVVRVYFCIYQYSHTQTLKTVRWSVKKCVFDVVKQENNQQEAQQGEQGSGSLDSIPEMVRVTHSKLLSSSLS